jgi:hypothetical protein
MELSEGVNRRTQAGTEDSIKDFAFWTAVAIIRLLPSFNPS